MYQPNHSFEIGERILCISRRNFDDNIKIEYYKISRIGEFSRFGKMSKSGDWLFINRIDDLKDTSRFWAFHSKDPYLKRINGKLVWSNIHEYKS